MITSVRQLPLLDIPDLDQVNWTSSVGSDNNGNVRLSINLNDNQNITNPTTTQSIKLNLESIPTAESVEAQGLSTFWKIVLSMITVTVLVVVITAPTVYFGLNGQYFILITLRFL
ncbi:unnamed protein product [Rotaria sp. Silwood1]|nr:unnamed protein product [Rotaria sp. Silwood1]